MNDEEIVLPESSPRMLMNDEEFVPPEGNPRILMNDEEFVPPLKSRASVQCRPLKYYWKNVRITL